MSRANTRAGSLASNSFLASLEPNAALIAQVRTFENFTQDNDPHHEHDFGSIEIAGTTFLWKIDCYDLSLQYGSSDPSDPAQTGAS